MSEKNDISVKEKNDLRYITPDVNINEDGDKFTLRAEMPGCSKEDISINLDKNELVIQGRAEIVEDGELVYAEFEPATYYRKFNIGNTVDRDKIEASMDAGVLTLTLQKSGAVKPLQIEIQD